jgi:hypothetical protein
MYAEYMQRQASPQQREGDGNSMTTAPEGGDNNR